MRRSPPSTSRTDGTTRPTPCRAVSSSGSRWPGRWRSGPGCSCSTSRRRTSTRTARPSCGSCSARVVERLGATLVLVEHRVDESLPLVDRVVVLAAGSGVVADGHPGAVFREHGTALADAGVWVPDHPPAAPPRRSRPRAGDPRHRRARRLPLPRRAGRRRRGRRPLGALVRGAGHHRPERERQVDAGAAGGRAARPARRTRDRRRGPLRGPRARADRRLAPAGPRCAGSAPSSRIRSTSSSPGRCGTSSCSGRARPAWASVAAAQRADELLERLRLTHLAAANPFTLSGGEKRRLSVASALATAPALLVLDEPTFGQDRRTWGELVQLLAALRDAGRGIAFATHDRAFVNALADRTFQLDGRR